MATSSISSTGSSAASAAEIAAANKSAAQKLLTSLGAGSGVDVAALAQNLVDAERVPQENVINAKITKNESKISGLAAVVFMMDEFKARLSELKDKTSYNALTASNSNTTALNITASTAATAGTYNIGISSLAKPQRSISSGFAASSTPVNGGLPFDLVLGGAKAGVSSGTTTNTRISQASIVAPAFGSPATTADFSNFSITVDGVSQSFTPAPASASLADLATDLQTQLSAWDSTLSVAVESNNLVVRSSDLTQRISALSLTADAAASGAVTGTASVPPTPTYLAKVSGISFGTSASVSDFKNFEITVDGKILSLTPAPATADMSALATDLQKQLRALDESTDLSVSISSTGELQFISSDITRKLSNPTLSQSTTIRLDTGASVGTPASTGNKITGIQFGTTPQTSDFKSFTVKIGDSVRTIIPAPDSPTVASLAADLQKRLRILEGSDDIIVTASGSDISVASASGKTIAQTALTRRTYADSPAGIVSAINDANRGVKAELVNDGSAGSPYKVMLVGATGASEAFSMSSAASGLSFVTQTGNEASDAQLTVNGVSYTRKSNSLSDVITGATVELRSTTTAEASVVFIQDTSAVRDRLKALVIAYNDVDNIITETTNPKSTLETYGKTLTGDATVRMVRMQMRSLFLGQSSTPGTAITSMGDLGFKTDQKGVLSLDEAKMDSALKSNYTDVVKALTGNQTNVSMVSTQPSGIMGDTVRRINKLLENSGPLKTKSETAATENTKNSEKLEKLKARMETLLARYTKQFAQMESLVGSANAQKTSLKATFDGMMASYTNK